MCFSAFDQEIQSILSKSKPWNETLERLISEPKTLLLGEDYTLSVTDEEAADRALYDQVFTIKLDDLSKVGTYFALQKDSEFLGIFNYYLLKEIEHGITKRLYRNYHMDLFVKEQFGMPEPQPLGINNVMFTFIMLGFGMCTAIAIATLECITKKCKRTPNTAWT